jgi:hypothetical protein
MVTAGQNQCKEDVVGIGVSFHGRDGVRKNFNLDGVPKPGDEAARMLGGAQRGVPATLAQKLFPEVNNFGGANDSYKVMLNRGDNDPGFLEDKISPSGAVTVTKKGLALKGDEAVESLGNGVYGVIKGHRRYAPLSAFDPMGEVKQLGPVGAGPSEPDNETAEDGIAAKWQSVTRLKLETDELGRLALYQYERDEQKTASGRVAVSAERRTLVGYVSWPSASEPQQAVSLPWTFEPGCGWSNTVYQLRYAINNIVSGANQTEDGDYCLQIDFKAMPAAASVVRDVTPGVYEIEDKVVVWVGRVEGGKQTEGIFQMPVIYAYE